MSSGTDPYDAIIRLAGWIEKNGWSGWDPYDVKGHPGIIRLAGKSTRNRAYVYLRELVYELMYRYPLGTRKLLGVRPAVNPKAMGLFSSAFLSLYRTFGEQRYLDKSIECMNWLLDHPDTGTGVSTAIGWGYPFDWQSGRLIPAGTPNGIVTTAAGDSLWQYYLLYHKKDSLNQCSRIAEFLFSLPADRLDRNKICFSYTPLYINHVHNLNLFVAEYLIKVGMELNRERWIEAGHQAVNYTLADQRADGSFDYNGPPEQPRNFIDHYHTGFVLRMLHSIWRLSNRKDVFESIEKCLAHYTTQFFEDDRIPKLTPERKYRIDIHSCAEAIHCLSDLSVQWPQCQSLASGVLSWTLENLQDPSGYFYYGILKSRITGRAYKSRIPYIRWSQAWMLKALAAYTENTTNQTHS